MPHLVATLIYLSKIYSYYIRGDRSPLNANHNNTSTSSGSTVSIFKIGLMFTRFVAFETQMVGLLIIGSYFQKYLLKRSVFNIIRSVGMMSKMVIRSHPDAGSTYTVNWVHMACPALIKYT